MRKTLSCIVAAIALSACATSGAPAPQARGMGGGGLENLLASDTNRDGTITSAEFADAREARFAQLDRDRDGYLTRADAAGAGQGRRGRGRLRAAAGGGGERLREAMAAVDANRDGRVSRAEFVDGPGRLFEVGDLDRNGRLDSREIEALRSRLAARRGG